MIPMPQRTAQSDLSQLTQLAQRFAHWRQNRPSPKARIPQDLWDQAVSLTLTTNLSVSRIAKQLGLCSTDLKKHCPASAPSTSGGVGDPPIHFVDVTPAAPWPMPTVKVDLKRADGAHFHLAYPQGTPGLIELIGAFLEPR